MIATRLSANIRRSSKPVATAVATLPFDFTWRERGVLGWAGMLGFGNKTEVKVPDTVNVNVT